MHVETSVVAERRAVVAGLETFWLEAQPRTPAPVLYVHGVPTHSADMLPFLERTGGVALDLPGFGRSAKPAGFEYSIHGYDRFIEAFITHLGWDRFSVVAHDWGSVALATAQRLAARVECVVLIDVVPFAPGYRWHRIARVWRTPVVGEIAMGFTTKSLFKLISREANASPGPIDPALIDMVWECFDHGTQRAILKLYRSAPPAALARAGEQLGAITSPALVLWGEQDPYIPASFAAELADRLPGGVAEVVTGAGHWPWLDRPEVIDRVAGFLAGDRP